MKHRRNKTSKQNRGSKNAMNPLNRLHESSFKKDSTMKRKNHQGGHKKVDNNNALAEALFVEVFDKKRKQVTKPKNNLRQQQQQLIRQNPISTSSEQGFEAPTFVMPQTFSQPIDQGPTMPQSRLGMDLLNSLEEAHHQREKFLKEERQRKVEEKFGMKNTAPDDNRFGMLQHDSDDDEDANATKNMGGAYFAPSTLFLPTRKIDQVFESSTKSVKPIKQDEPKQLESGFAAPTFTSL